MEDFLDKIEAFLLAGDLDAAQTLTAEHNGASPLKFEVGQALIQSTLGNQQGFVKHLRSAEVHGSDSARVLHLFASGRLLEDDRAEAEAFARKSLQQGDHIRTWEMLAGMLSIWPGRDEDAKEAYASLLARQPDNYNGRLGLASLHGRVGDLPAALLQLSKAALNSPEEQTPWQSAVQMFTDQGWGFGAQALLSITRQGHHEDDVYALLDFTRLAIATSFLGAMAEEVIGDPSEINDGLIKLAANLTAPLQLRIVRHVYSYGDLTNAQSVLELVQTEGLKPFHHGEALFLEALIVDKLGDPGEAVELYTQCLEVDPYRLDAAANATVILLHKAKDGEDVLDEFEEIIGAVPDYLRRGFGPLYINEALYLNHQGEHGDAKAIFESLVDDERVGMYARKALEDLVG